MQALGERGAPVPYGWGVPPPRPHPAPCGLAEHLHTGYYEPFPAAWVVSLNVEKRPRWSLARLCGSGSGGGGVLPHVLARPARTPTRAPRGAAGTPPALAALPHGFSYPCVHWRYHCAARLCGRAPGSPMACAAAPLNLLSGGNRYGRAWLPASAQRVRLLLPCPAWCVRATSLPVSGVCARVLPCSGGGALRRVLSYPMRSAALNAAATCLCACDALYPSTSPTSSHEQAST